MATDEEQACTGPSFWELEHGREELRRREERRRRGGRRPKVDRHPPAVLSGGCLLYRFPPERAWTRDR